MEKKKPLDERVAALFLRGMLEGRNFTAQIISTAALFLELKQQRRSSFQL
jgi:hypothetical protein